MAIRKRDILVVLEKVEDRRAKKWRHDAGVIFVFEAAAELYTFAVDVTSASAECNTCAAMSSTHFTPSKSFSRRCLSTLISTFAASLYFGTFRLSCTNVSDDD